MLAAPILSLGSVAPAAPPSRPSRGRLQAEFWARDWRPLGTIAFGARGFRGFAFRRPTRDGATRSAVRAYQLSFLGGPSTAQQLAIVSSLRASRLAANSSVCRALVRT